MDNTSPGNNNNDLKPLDISDYLEANIDLIEYEHHKRDMSSLYWRYTLLNSISAPIAVFNELADVIFIVISNRLIDLVIDLVSPGQKLAKNAISLILGIYQIITFLNKSGDNSLSSHYLFLTILAIYTAFVATHKRAFKISRMKNAHTILTLMMALAPIMYNEYLILYQEQLMNAQLRAILMTASMKFVSVLASDSRDPLEISSYLIHPVSSIFGPWHQSFNTDKPEITLRRLYIGDLIIQFWHFTTTLLKAFSILTILELVTQFKSTLELYPTLDKILTVYLTAMEFRFSHYFACLLSQAFLTLWVGGLQKRITLCDIARVEWPRSLVEVVVSWNIPMHRWLKFYVFKPIRSQTSNPLIAILLTYFVSSTLHGFKFNIWAVLLSIGSLSWVEYRIRSILACKLDACVLARDCDVTGVNKLCARGHIRTKSNSIMVNIVNFLFRSLAMANLAYLGCIFVGNSDEQSFRDALSIWGDLWFISHVLGILMIIPIFYCEN